MMTLDEIKTKVDELARKIDAPLRYLPKYGESVEGISIQSDSRGYHYIARERGDELIFTTNDIDELLYRIFETVASGLALDFELANRIEAQDFRRLYFRHTVKLLFALSPDWAQRQKAEYEKNPSKTSLQ